MHGHGVGRSNRLDTGTSCSGRISNVRSEPRRDTDGNACMEAAQGLRSLSLSSLRGCPLLTTWEMGGGSPPFAGSQSQCLRGGADDGHAPRGRTADGAVTRHVNDRAGVEIHGPPVRHHRLTANEAEPHEMSLAGISSRTGS